VVERGPEKAGVGGSIPSLATTLQIVGPFNYTGAERRWPGRIWNLRLILRQ